MEKSSFTQLVYVSAATVDFSPQDLDELLTKARANNSGLDVTGVLLYTGGTFFQVLEGEPEIVDSLYHKIQSDKRHNNVLLLENREIEERNFGDWSMGFVADQKEIRQLPGFVDFFSSGHSNFLDLRGQSKRIRGILDGFRQGRWRREAHACPT